MASVASCLELLNESGSNGFLDNANATAFTFMTYFYIVRVFSTVTITYMAQLLSINFNLYGDDKQGPLELSWSRRTLWVAPL